MAATLCLGLPIARSALVLRQGWFFSVLKWRQIWQAAHLVRYSLLQWLLINSLPTAKETPDSRPACSLFVPSLVNLSNCGCSYVQLFSLWARIGKDHIACTSFGVGFLRYTVCKILRKRFSVAVSSLLPSTPFLMQWPFVKYCVSYVTCTVLQTMTLVQSSTVVGRFVTVRSFSAVQVAQYPDCRYFVAFFSGRQLVYIGWTLFVYFRIIVL